MIILFMKPYYIICYLKPALWGIMIFIPYWQEKYNLKRWSDIAGHIGSKVRLD